MKTTTHLFFLFLFSWISSAQSVIENSIFWKDTEGNTIEAHGSGFIKVDDTYYMIGEDKSHNAHTFKAVNCYASKDLVNWEFRNAIITPETHPSLVTDRVIERPKVIYNKSTKQFVMWVHFESGNYGQAEAGVFYADTIDGDYTFHKSFRPFGKMARDCTLFVDDDGTAYFAAAANENADMEIYRLTDDYMDVAANVITLWPGAWREAPALFKHNEVYYMVTSGATGWSPNQAKYAYASSITGPWSDLIDLGDGTTYDSQSNYVIPVYGTEQTTFIFSGDRWQDPDLRASKYIWLPLTIEGTTLTLDFYQRWSIDAHTGRWDTYTDPLTIPETSWSVHYADSWDAVYGGEPEKAFDNDPLTFWHTEWVDQSPAPPHEIQIDLGDTYSLQKFRLLPRQDGNFNGMIKDYELYVSDTAEDWGSPVSSGTLQGSFSEKEITIVPKSGRYVRLVATSETNGNPWTSLAELDILKTLVASEIPDPPTDLTAQAITYDAIQLSWSDASDQEYGFVIERSDSGSRFQKIAELPKDQTYFLDEGLTAASWYSYRIKAFNDIGSSPCKAIVSERTHPPLLSQLQWSLHAVSSEEIEGDDNKAIYAFDGDIQTFWHSRWSGTTATHPHEIEIDLGGLKMIEVLRYLPRQSGGQNGTIKEYEIHTSLDGEHYRKRISGTWYQNTEEKFVLFRPTPCRYIKLIAISEINGGEWASAAEINLNGREINSFPISSALFKTDEIVVFPNPVRGSLNVEYTANQTEMITINLIHPRGVLIKSLLYQKLEAGTHHFNWNLKNEYKKGHGLYFLEIQKDGITIHVEKLLFE